VELIVVLLPFALLFAGIALALFVWAARSGQFDDLETPAVRILFDDETPVPAGKRRAATSAPAPAAGGPDKERP
jgi:cbb3-type cytochrome oxidase maturation protein